jgi:DNA-binding response OmpR family regulator
MKLLIAEDDDLFVKLLKQLLEPDYELEVARDGDEAWKVLQHPAAPRLAILDWVMPGLSGPEICRRVRGSATLSSTYLILLTARNSTADIVSGLRAGADDYIMKPPIPEELRARITMGKRMLALQEAIQAKSLLARQASEEQRFREGVAAGLFYGRQVVQQNLLDVADYLSRHPQPAEITAPDSGADVHGPANEPLIHALENSHS